MLRRGWLHWAEMDKRRPVLILSPESRNERASDLIVVPCSSVLRGGPWHVRLRSPLNRRRQSWSSLSWVVSGWFTFLTAVLAVFGFLRR